MQDARCDNLSNFTGDQLNSIVYRQQSIFTGKMKAYEGKKDSKFNSL